jgi:ankyrin repeat protein
METFQTFLKELSRSKKSEQNNKYDELQIILNSIQDENVCETLINTVFKETTLCRLKPTALLISCLHGFFKIAELLLSKKADINLKFNDHSTALTHCCEYSLNYDTSLLQIKFLIDNKADINHIDSYQYSSLYYACRIENCVFTKLLLDNNANINLKCGIYHRSAAMTCVKLNNKDTLMILLDYQADLTLLDDDGKNIIILCCESNNCDILKLLLHHTDIYQSFDKTGVDINHTDNTGYTGLMVACNGSKSIDIIDTLLKYNANASISDNEGKNAFILSCCNGRLDILKLLIRHKDESIIDGAGININDVDCKGWTGLMHACNQSNFEIIEFLLNTKADASIISYDGKSALSIIKFQSYTNSKENQRISILIEESLNEPYILK